MGAIPLLIRLRRFDSLTSGSGSMQPGFGRELTKPLRLAQLHSALSGAAGDGAATAAGDVTVAPGAALPMLHGRVLLVEDQPLNREVALGILASLGLETDTADSGKTALAKLAEQRFDAVLMDCEMPVMDGFSATAALRGREAGKTHTVVIALTADATPAGRDACLAAGMDDYLTKPFRREALHAMLTQWLPNPAGASRAAPAVAAASSEPLLNMSTLEALRALPRSGTKDMLHHIGELYLSESVRLIGSIEGFLETQDSAGLARTAHAWRSYNGNVGAQGLERLCRELEDHARRGNLSAAREVYARMQILQERVRDALQSEMRRSA
jgi:CheY-like chemotaxis protein/HPt (histidine-containing phosphotransfer) domain-containing protein